MSLIELFIDSEEYFDNIRKHDTIVLYGAGTKGKQTIELLRNINVYPKAFIDSNAPSSGGIYEGIPLIKYETLLEEYEDYCILITCVYQNAMSIYEKLMKYEEKHPIFFTCNPYKAENKFLTSSEIKYWENNLTATYNELADEKSKEIFIHFINQKITGDVSKIATYTEGNWMEFFSSNLLPVSERYTYIDIGAYTGDTIIRFLSFCQGKYEKIICFEPDKVNFSIVNEVVEKCRLENIELHNLGLWMKPEKKRFFSAGFVYESSNFFRDTKNTIAIKLSTDLDNLTSVDFIQVDTLDYVLKEAKDNLIIKIDALASEVPILYGASQIIKEKKPIIIMEYGTHSEYMADTIPYLLKLNPDYHFYLRQMFICNNSRTILYVI